MYTQVIVTPKLDNKTNPKYRSILSVVHVNVKKNIPAGITIAGMAFTPSQQATTSPLAFLLRYRVYPYTWLTITVIIVIRIGTPKPSK